MACRTPCESKALVLASTSHFTSRDAVGIDLATVEQVERPTPAIDQTARKSRSNGRASAPLSEAAKPPSFLSWAPAATAGWWPTAQKL